MDKKEISARLREIARLMVALAHEIDEPDGNRDTKPRIPADEMTINETTVEYFDRIYGEDIIAYKWSRTLREFRAYWLSKGSKKTNDGWNAALRRNPIIRKAMEQASGKVEPGEDMRNRARAPYAAWVKGGPEPTGKIRQWLIDNHFASEVGGKLEKTSD